jgi:hypothetical protein
MPYTPGNDPYSAILEGLLAGRGLKRQARQEKLGEQQTAWDRARLERGEQRGIEQTGYERGRDLQSDQSAVMKSADEWRTSAPTVMANGPEAYADYVRTYESHRPHAKQLGIELPSMPQYDPRYFGQAEQQRKVGTLKDTSTLYGKILSMESPQGIAAGRAAGLAVPTPQAPPQLPAGPPVAQGQPQGFNMLREAFPGMAPPAAPSLPPAPAEPPMWETPGKELTAKRSTQWKAALAVLPTTDPNTEGRMSGLEAAAPDFPEIQAGLLGVARMTGAQEADVTLGQNRLNQTITYQGGILEHYKTMEGIARTNSDIARIRANAYTDAQKLSGQARGKLTAKEYARIITSCAGDVQKLKAAKIKGKGVDANGATMPWSAQQSQQIDQLIADREANRDLALQGQQGAATGGADLHKTVPEWQDWIRAGRRKKIPDGQLQQYMVDHLWSAVGAAGLLGRTR